ncbi:MAG: hypothetical protein AB7T49_15705 [Oligoflexales bacterium]
MFAGLHISGPNAFKTSFVAVSGKQNEPLQIECVYERIGSTARRLSDERLVEIILLEGPFKKISVDCPLSEPPCVRCIRPICPGTMACDDVSVAYLLALSQKRKSAKKFFNPQTNRLWDIVSAVAGDGTRLEPTYSPNMAPIATRAKTLQKRLNSLGLNIELAETSVPYSLVEFAKKLKMSEDIPAHYRNFEHGNKTRREIFEKMQETGLLSTAVDLSTKQKIVKTVENFQAFVTAVVSAYIFYGKFHPKPNILPREDGWVYVPIIE